MPNRENPYSAFNFRVALGNEGGQDQIVGGFSDVSGLDNEVKYSEYRNGNDPENHVRKIAGVNLTGNATFKRGVIDDTRLFDWLKTTREGNFDPRTVTVTLLDEGHRAVCTWTLLQAQPQKWTGPTLTGAGGSTVAMEELSLVAERIDFKLTSG
jgi:phage tail-like protein